MREGRGHKAERGKLPLLHQSCAPPLRSLHIASSPSRRELPIAGPLHTTIKAVHCPCTWHHTLQSSVLPLTTPLQIREIHTPALQSRAGAAYRAPATSFTKCIPRDPCTTKLNADHRPFPPYLLFLASLTRNTLHRPSIIGQKLLHSLYIRLCQLGPNFVPTK